MIGWIIAAVIIAAVVGFVIWISRIEDCPREMAGWQCKGSRCDHSEEAIIKARRSLL